MQQDLTKQNPFYWLYIGGIFLAIMLPMLTFPPLFYPSDWGKPIILRSITAIMILLLTYQLLFKKIDFADKFNFLKKNKIVWGIGLVFLTFLLSTILSSDIRNSFWASPYRGGGFISFVFYLIFALVAFLVLKKEDWRRVWLLSLITGLIISFIAIIQFYGILSAFIVKVDVRPSSTMGNPIFLAVYLAFLFFVTLSLALREKNSKMRAFYIASLLVFSYAILLAASRAAFLGIVAGTIYFVFFYPKKHLVLKASMAVLLTAMILLVALVNIYPSVNEFLSKSKTGEALISRLSIESVLKEERFSAWKIAFRAAQDKPILGYGMENVSIGFDKYYDPNIVYDPWWDRAHNIFLDLSLQVGLLGLTSYLILFGIIIYYLFKERRRGKEDASYFMAHGVLAALIAYFVANIFSFDSFGTYLMFALTIGYTLHICFSHHEIKEPANNKEYKKPFGAKVPSIAILAIIVIVFLWQYNLSPLLINGKINQAIDYSNIGNCEKSLNLMRDVIGQKSYIDSYLRMMYIRNLQNCISFYPSSSRSYAVEGEPILEEGIMLQPSYTRFWFYLGSYKTLIANTTEDQGQKKQIIKEAYEAFDKAESLSPKHQETLIERAKLDMIADNYQQMKDDTQRCSEIKFDDYQCYWFRYLADILLQDKKAQEEDLALARKYGFDEQDKKNYLYLYQLVTVYTKLEDYKNIAITYEKLILLSPTVPDYRSSLAFAYYNLGEYQKAREQAMEFLKLMPSAKAETEEFLKLLPY